MVIFVQLSDAINFLLEEFLMPSSTGLFVISLDVPFLHVSAQNMFFSHNFPEKKTHKNYQN